MNLLRRIDRIQPGERVPSDGPVMVYADELAATLPAGNAGDQHTMSINIQQLLPLGSVFTVDFADATIPAAIIRRDNSTAGVLDVYLYYFANIAGGSVNVHFAGVRHQAFP
jgi:hypothetical protein